MRLQSEEKENIETENFELEDVEDLEGSEGATVEETNFEEPD